jgi:hypothetical protein
MRTIVASAIVLTAALAASDAEAACRTVTLAGQPLFDDCKLIRMRQSPGELEVVRFPRGSSNPTFIVLTEFLPAMTGSCTNATWRARDGDCSHFDICSVVIDVDPAKLPVITRLWRSAADNFNGVLRLGYAGSEAQPPEEVTQELALITVTTGNGETIRIVNADLRMNAAGCWGGIHAQYARDLARFYK